MSAMLKNNKAIQEHVVLAWDRGHNVRNLQGKYNKNMPFILIFTQLTQEFPFSLQQLYQTLTDYEPQIYNND